MTHFPAGHLSRIALSARANAGLGNASVCFLSQNVGVFFFFPEAPNLISRLGISVDPRTERAVHFFSCAGEKTRPRKPGNERFASFAETRDGFAHRLRAFSPRRDEIIDAFSRFRRTRKRVSRTSPPESYCVKTSESDALRDAHARSFSTLAMSGSVTRAPALACDRAELQTGIVHFGVGGFHRSHQQVRLPFRKSLFFRGKRVSRQAKDAARGARVAATRANARASRRIASDTSTGASHVVARAFSDVHSFPPQIRPPFGIPLTRRSPIALRFRRVSRVSLPSRAGVPG
jgi:hypothetical protein